MIQKRRRSVPPGATSNHDLPTTKGGIQGLATTSSSSYFTAPTKNPKLFAQADALTKMTFELNLRAVCGHAEHLENEVRKLVLRTELDKGFRHENEKRLADMMCEIQAVKTSMAMATDGQVDLKGGFERQQRETTKVIDGFRREMRDLKGLIDGLGSQLDQFPSFDDINRDIQVPAAPAAPSRGMETRAMRRANPQVDTQPPDQQSKTTLSLHSKHPLADLVF